MYGNAVKLLLHTEITLLINAFSRYEFDLTDAKSELTVIEFAAADEKWLDFICNNRSGKPTGDYDTQILLNTQIRATSSLKINWLLYILLN
ncbi:MAG: hypothetical protein IKB93_06540 [Clostridia bacterium]|nr:hypothetical protein [Clostridia bacterium]